MTEQNEPSMEDILASIRNILADEEGKDDKDSRQNSSEQGNDGVVTLTADMVVNDGKNAKNAAEQAAEESDEDDFTPEPVIPSQPMKEETLSDLIRENAREAKPSDDDVLMSRPTIEAAAHSLSGLRDFAAEQKGNLGNGSLTLETIVRESVKPYLKEWLDAHLPEIVERIVKKEVAYIMDRLNLK